MHYIVVFEYGMELESDKASFKESLRECKAANPDKGEEELVFALLEGVRDFSMALANGVKKLVSFKILVDGYKTHINIDKVAYIQVIGAVEYIQELIDYAEKMGYE